MTAVDVHWVDLDRAAADLPRWLRLLDADERARADRFRFDRDRRRFIARRGWLRERLSDCVGSSPGALRFRLTRFGKPSLTGHGLTFSLSHSAGMALCAIADGLELGCDVERRDPSLASPLVAKRYFSPAEQARLTELSGDRWLEGFFNCWTRKEAFIKALGLGLSYPLEAFDVSLAPQDEPRLLRGCEGWSVQAFKPAPGFTAAVVAAGVDWTLSFPAPAPRFLRGPAAA